MREDTQRETDCLEALKAHAVRARLSAKALSSEEVSERTVEKILAGETAFHRDVARLGAMYEQGERADAAAAVELVEAVLRAAGIAVTLVPDSMVVTEADGLVPLVARAGAGQGECDAAVLRAVEDGAIDPDEDAEIQRRFREQRRRNYAIALSSRRMAAERQPAFRLEACR